MCFGMYGDPTGEDLIFALRRDEGGEYRVRYIPSPYSDSTVEQLRASHPELGGPRPPSAGNSSAAGDSPPREHSNEWMFLSSIGAGMLLLTLVMLLGGTRNDRRTKR